MQQEVTKFDRGRLAESFSRIPESIFASFVNRWVSKCFAMRTEREDMALDWRLIRDRMASDPKLDDLMDRVRAALLADVRERDKPPFFVDRTEGAAREMALDWMAWEVSRRLAYELSLAQTLDSSMLAQSLRLTDMSAALGVDKSTIHRWLRGDWMVPRYALAYAEARRLCSPENRRLLSGVLGAIANGEAVDAP